MCGTRKGVAGAVQGVSEGGGGVPGAAGRADEGWLARLAAHAAGGGGRPGPPPGGGRHALSGWGMNELLPLLGRRWERHAAAASSRSTLSRSRAAWLAGWDARRTRADGLGRLDRAAPWLDRPVHPCSSVHSKPPYLHTEHKSSTMGLSSVLGRLLLDILDPTGVSTNISEHCSTVLISSHAA